MVDYLVIGGGVYGAACAWELGKAGREVRLIEAHAIASAASGGPGRRGVRANMRDPRELPLMAQAYQRWPTLHEELNGALEFETTGHLTLIERLQDLESAPARVLAQRSAGIETNLLGREQVAEMEPDLAPDILGAIHCPNDGVAAHARVTGQYAAAARALGAAVDEHTALESCEFDGTQIRAVRTNTGERIEINKACILVANSATAGLLESAMDIHLPLWSTALQVLLVKANQPVNVRHLIGHASRTVAIKAEPGGLTMISGGYRGRWFSDEHRGETLPEAVQANIDQASAVYPGLASATVEIADANHQETMSIDGVPVIDRAAADSNLFFATGWSGHGWAISPAVSRLLCEWVMSGTRPALLEPFHKGRFGTA
ncbi:MAG: FAD-binding oxidoreductase [Chromatiales bacterium]|jgi:sarcosine oxidase, subunit beta|nr:FAD-binding oxidoreductase [Chromatiales bacterium]